ncbi:MAG: C-terminal binding protein [Bryobacteraceae bacterium]
MKVVVTDYVEPDLKWEAAEMARRGIEFACHQLKFTSTASVVAATRDADVVVVNMVPITAEVVAGWEKCRLAIRHGVGYDNVDLAALERARIPLCYIPDYCTEEVAEQASASILACARKIVWSRQVLDESSASGTWDFAGTIPVFRVAGKTVGLLGCGRIGSRVYQKLKSFGVRFLIADPYLSKERKEELGIEVVDAETVFRESDFVTVHVPLNSETRHIVRAETLRLMKPTAYLINTARGPLVDSAALAEALRQGVIAGAAIDVFDVEPPPPDHPLFHAPNIVLTPHMAWYSEEAAWRIRELILLEIDRLLEGCPPRYIAKAENSKGEDKTAWAIKRDRSQM